MINRVIAIDPGREKCGVAVVDDNQGVLYQKVILSDTLVRVANELMIKFNCADLVIGNGTSSKEHLELIEKHMKPEIQMKIHRIDEYKTTEMARQRYWIENPPRGWRKLLPLGMQVPPQPVDDYVAVLLGEKFLEKCSKKGGITFLI